jgi:hypothetical protein
MDTTRFYPNMNVLHEALVLLKESTTSISLHSTRRAAFFETQLGFDSGMCLPTCFSKSHSNSDSLSAALLTLGSEGEGIRDSSRSQQQGVEMGKDGYTVVWMKYSRKDDAHVEVKPYR